MGRIGNVCVCARVRIKQGWKHVDEFKSQVSCMRPTRSGWLVSNESDSCRCVMIDESRTFSFHPLHTILTFSFPSFCQQQMIDSLS